MGQYEDLLKFQEKTRMKSIQFVDFTKQNKQVNHGQWSIVHQLAKGNISSSSPVSPGLISSTHHQPSITQATDPVHLAPLRTAYSSASPTSSLFKEIGIQLNRSVGIQHEAQPEPQPAVQAQFQPHPTAQALPQFQPQPAAQKPSRAHFSHLFTASVDEHPVDIKDASLQSLLKRIATCR